MKRLIMALAIVGFSAGAVAACPHGKGGEAWDQEAKTATRVERQERRQAGYYEVPGYELSNVNLYAYVR